MWIHPHGEVIGVGVKRGSCHGAVAGQLGDPADHDLPESVRKRRLGADLGKGQWNDDTRTHHGRSAANSCAAVALCTCRTAPPADDFSMDTNASFRVSLWGNISGTFFGVMIADFVDFRWSWGGDRDYEHHARIRDGADARDRSAKISGGEAGRYTAAVPDSESSARFRRLEEPSA